MLITICGACSFVLVLTSDQAEVNESAFLRMLRLLRLLRATRVVISFPDLYQLVSGMLICMKTCFVSVTAP